MGVSFTVEINEKLVAQWLHNVEGQKAFPRIKFMRALRCVEPERFCKQIGLDLEEYHIFENAPNHFAEKEKLPKLLIDVTRILGCSHRFLLGYTNYVYDEGSNEISQNEYERMAIKEELIFERIANVIREDGLKNSIPLVERILHI